MNKIASALDDDVCKALLGFHAYTGCDSVSAFSGRGKVTALKVLMNNPKFQDAFCKLGNEWSLPDSLMDVLEEFTCQMYSLRTHIADVDEMRFQLFRAKTGDIQSGQLPPCLDCLKLHAARACYQAAIWHRSLEPTPHVPDPYDCEGWSLDEEGELTIEWMSGTPAPVCVLEFLSCKCKRVCQLPTCTCMQNGLKCTDACVLEDCANMTQTAEEFEQSSDEDSDDGD